LAYRKHYQEQKQVEESAPALNGFKEDDDAVVLLAADLVEISPLVGQNIRTREDLIEAVRKLSTVTVEGADVTLEPGLLIRLKSRCLDKARFPEFMRKTVRDCLHSYVGW
jgi:hypothetical protein